MRRNADGFNPAALDGDQSFGDKGRQEKDDAIREMAMGGYGFHEIWVNLPSWIADLDVDDLRRKAGIPAPPAMP